MYSTYEYKAFESLTVGILQPGSFAYDEKAYVDALEQFVQAVDLKEPFAVVTHGCDISDQAP